MILKGEAYCRRLASYSKETINLFTVLSSYSCELALKVNEIASNSEYDENEVVKRLEKLRSKDK